MGRTWIGPRPAVASDGEPVTYSSAEVWRPVTGFEGRYEVSDQGRVRTAEGYGRVAFRKLNASGRYLTVCVSVGPYQRRNLTVHRMVCEAFHGPMPAWADRVRHLNDEKHDNRAVNLAWGTHADNMRDRVRNGRDPEARRTSCDRGHPYIEGSYSVSRGARRCLACHRDHERRRKNQVAR